MTEPRLVPAGSWHTSVVTSALLLALLSPSAVSAQDQNGAWDARQILEQKQFVSPPASVVEAVLAPRYLNVSLSDVSPDKMWFLHEIGDGPVSMDVFSKPFHELGGKFIDFEANRSRQLTTRNNVGIAVVSASGGSRVEIEVPRGARVSNASWSPDGSRLAFFAHFDENTHIYVADPATGRSQRITRRPVLATLVTTFEWTAEGDKIATVLIPEDRPSMPSEPTVPRGPQVKMTEPGENHLRTYASLMETPHDEALLAWHSTGQLALVDVDNRDVDYVGEPAMVKAFDFSSDGLYARVSLMEHPFSYIVPVNNFAVVEEIWNAEGDALAELSRTPINTGLPDPDRPPPAPGASRFDLDDPAGRRQVSWRVDGRGLTYLERVPTSADGEADEGKEDRSDRVMQWLPPFDDTSLSEVFESDKRIAAHRFSPNMSILFLTERRGDRVLESVVFLDDPVPQAHTLVEFDSEEFYANPGSLVMRGGRLPAEGRPRRGVADTRDVSVQLSADGAHVFFYGTRYNADPLDVAPKTFLDRVAIRTGATERIFEGENEGAFERLTSILDVDSNRFIVSRESPNEVAQSYLVQGPNRVQITNNIDYTPDLTAAPRERFTVIRPDGFSFLVNVTLPTGYQAGTRLPAMFWFYPREYEDQESYDERGRDYNKNAFPNFGTRSIEYLTRLGYAVVEPDAPIVGKPGQMNNNYQHDLRNNLAAVIDELDRRQIIDRSRLGLGGHSYGAFSTVNAMVHTPFFKAGIAGDGNYNRTFTPLSFQSERRFLWDAKDVYLGMSPFLYANNLTGALLMYHGLQDQNVGTDPDHSPRLFHALNGLGKEAAMYLYPFEDHGPATKETLLDLWGRWAAWLDVHLLAPETGTRTISDLMGRPD
jgi:dipeptidyl aminopeptidase/acylaminoacyl peptidase